MDHETQYMRLKEARNWMFVVGLLLGALIVSILWVTVGCR
jgi:uncharacterized membrane protein YciS (DUF1049 family)